MKKLLLLLALFVPVCLVSCGGDDNNEPNEKNMLDFKIDDLNSYFSEWIIGGTLEDGKEKPVGSINAGDRSFEITRDGKFIRHQNAYNFTADYTFDKGVFTCKRNEPGHYEIATYKFSHYDEDRLQVKAIRHVNDMDPKMTVYLVWKYNF